MNHTVARLAFVVTIAAIVGVFVGIVVYFTLVAALIFLLLAAVITLAIRRINRPKRMSLKRAELIRDGQRRIKTIKAGEHTSPDLDSDQT